jgi:hypothetical protein
MALSRSEQFRTLTRLFLWWCPGHHPDHHHLLPQVWGPALKYSASTLPETCAFQQPRVDVFDSKTLAPIPSFFRFRSELRNYCNRRALENRQSGMSNGAPIVLALYRIYSYYYVHYGPPCDHRWSMAPRCAHRRSAAQSQPKKGIFFSLPRAAFK